MLSSFASLEVLQEEVSSDLTLILSRGDLSPEWDCLIVFFVASRSKLPRANPAWSTDVGAVVCQPPQPHLQRACSQVWCKLSTKSPPSPGLFTTSLLSTHCTVKKTSSNREIQSPQASQRTEEKGVT